MSVQSKLEAVSRRSFMALIGAAVVVIAAALTALTEAGMSDRVAVSVALACAAALAALLFGRLNMDAVAAPAPASHDTPVVPAPLPVAELSTEPGAWKADTARVSQRIFRHFGIDVYQTNVDTFRRVMPSVPWNGSYTRTLAEQMRDQDGVKNFSERDEAMWVAEHINFNALLRDADLNGPYRQMWELICVMASEHGPQLDPDLAFIPARRNFEICTHLIATSDTAFVLSRFVEQRGG